MFLKKRLFRKENVMKGLVKLFGLALIVAGVYLIGIEAIEIFELGIMFVSGVALAIIP